tara:strand:- start:2260 stop:3441 length:1182 start_codon:yes stop_codon:yes gene_type:complete
MATQGISFAQFSKIAPYIVRSRKPIMGHGPHGIGKSELVYQLADKLVDILGEDFKEKYGKNYVFPVIERRASQMADTGDVIGVPEPKDSDYGRITTFAPMGWFAQACNEPCILFFDEVDRANNDVRQSLMELTDSRKIAGHTLHPDTIIISMVNGGTHDENNTYQVSELDPAEHDRWWHVNLEPTVEDWIDWGKDIINPMIIDFIRHNPNHLEHKSEVEPHKVYPSRRSWAHFNKCVALASENMLEHNDNKKISMDLYFIGEGFIGQEASIAFRDFVEKYERQVSVEDILNGRRGDIVSDFGINDSNAMVDKIAESKEFKGELTEEHLKNVALFITNISPELAMKAWESLTRANGEAIAKMWSVNVSDGKSFGNYIAEIVGNPQENVTPSLSK